jgi:hypothetical protein
MSPNKAFSVPWYISRQSLYEYLVGSLSLYYFSGVAAPISITWGSRLLNFPNDEPPERLSLLPDFRAYY